MHTYEVVITVVTKKPIEEFLPNPDDRVLANILDVAEDNRVTIREVRTVEGNREEGTR